MSKAFPARYPGVCWDCGGGFLPDDLIRFTSPDDGAPLVHDACPPVPVARPACPTCFIELPIAGVCSECGG